MGRFEGEGSLFLARGKDFLGMGKDFLGVCVWERCRRICEEEDERFFIFLQLPPVKNISK